MAHDTTRAGFGPDPHPRSGSALRLLRGALPTRLAFLAVLALALHAAPCAMHAAGFLAMKEAPGESTDAAHTGWIDLRGFEMTTVPGAPGARAAASASLVLQKSTDTASPVLAGAVGSGQTFAKAQLEFTQTGGRDREALVFYRIELSGVQVTSHALHATSDGGTPTEVFTLTFQSATWAYTQFTATGRASARQEVAWDLLRGEAILRTIPLGFTVRGVTQSDGRVGIQWTPVPGRPYVLHQAQNPAGPFSPVLKIEPATSPDSRWVELPKGFPFAFFRLEESE